MGAWILLLWTGFGIRRRLGRNSDSSQQLSSNNNNNTTLVRRMNGANHKLLAFTVIILLLTHDVLSASAAAPGRTRQLSAQKRRCPKGCSCTASEKMEEVVCDQGGLRESQFLKLLTKIPVTTQSLRIIGPKNNPNNFSITLDFIRFKRLEQLHLVNCGLRSLGKRVFSNLKSLETLNLESNFISYLSPETFEYSSHIKHLSLARNKLGKALLPTGAFSHLKQLKSLSLAGNNIQQFPASLLGGLSDLHTLILDGNTINNTVTNRLGSIITDTPNLVRLDLNDIKNLGTVSPNTFKSVPRLQYLSLQGNGLEFIPHEALLDLPKLSHLNLGGNRIASVHPNALIDTTVTSLNLAGNQLGAASDDCPDETALAGGHIPSGFNNCALGPSTSRSNSFQKGRRFRRKARLSSGGSGAKVLTNRLSPYGIHPEAFANSGLVALDLSNNSFSRFDGSVLQAVRSTLAVLNLSENPLRVVDSGQLWDLNLTELHLASVGLRSLPLRLPSAYANILKLNLSGNQLTMVPDSTVRSLNPNLLSLDIRRNQFSHLTGSFRSLLLRLTQVYLSHNPWHCDCGITALRNRLQKMDCHKFDINNVKCATPHDLAGMPLTHVQSLTECTVIFGAASGLTQQSEIGILIAAVLAVLMLVGIGGLIGCYSRSCGSGRAGSYRTGEDSQGHLSPCSSEPSEESDDHVPMPPPTERLF